MLCTWSSIFITDLMVLVLVVTCGRGPRKQRLCATETESQPSNATLYAVVQHSILFNVSICIIDWVGVSVLSRCVLLPSYSVYGFCWLLQFCDHVFAFVPVGSPSCGGDGVVYVLDKSQLALLTPFCSVLVSVSVFTVLSTLFRSKNSPSNSPLSYSALLVLFLPYWSFQLYISLW